MTKSIKKLFGLLLVLSSFAFLFGCQVLEQVYEVTFKDNGTVVAVVEVQAGGTITAEQLPADPVKEGYIFEGWYNGDVKLSLDTKYNVSTTYEAKYSVKPLEVYAVKFVVEGVEVKSVNVTEGQAIDILEIPEDPTLKAYEFVGWFNGETELDEMAKVTGNATYTAKFERSHYIAIFKNGDDTQEVLVPVNGVLNVDEIENPVVENAYFAGWFANGVEAKNGLALEADTVFEPKFVTLESFNGVWYNEDGDYLIIENGKVTGGEYGSNGITFTFDLANGELVYEADSFYVDKTVISATAAGIKVVHTYWDDIYEEMASDSYELVLAGDSEYEGTYRADNTGIIVITKGGVVLKHNNVSTYKGLIKEVEGQLVLIYKTSSYSSAKTVNAQIDEFGNLVVENTIYVKDSTSFQYFYYSYDYPTFHFFTVGENTVVTVKENGVYVYGSVEGNVAVGEIMTVTYGEKTLTFKAVSDTTYELAGEEQGTYTNGDVTMVLNGFGDATINENTYEYVVNGQGYVICNGLGYVLDKENGTYEVIEKDSITNGTYILNSNNKYTLNFDGFGGVVLYYTSSYSQYEYLGKYTLKNNVVTIKMTQSGYYADGDWTIEENGNILAGAKDIYLLEGATFEDVRETLDGKYGEDGSIVVSSATSQIEYKGETYSLTYNYNGSKASFEVKHKDSYEGWYEATFTDVYTISVKENGNLFIEIAHQTWDEYGEGAEITKLTEEYAAYVPATLDAFAGTWSTNNGAYGNPVTIVINGDGTGTYNETPITYTISGTKLSFVVNWEDYSLNGDPATGTLEVQWQYDYMDMEPFDVTKEVESTLDAFAGTWTGKNAFGVSVTVVIDGEGKGTYNGGDFTYTISGNKLSFTYNWEDYSLNGDPTTGSLTVQWTYDYSDMPEFTVTK